MIKEVNNKVFNSFKQFFKDEATSGIVLLIYAIFALILANSNYSYIYNEILHTKIAGMSVLHWINDGLMAIFFFVVGMEIKKEILIGELKSIKTTILPISAAIAGMIVPAIIYSLINYNQPTLDGFGIPMATDIAFALGIISLVGKKAPKGIVVFLTALAIVDDLGAIIVIAVFYTSKISVLYLLLSLIIVCGLIIANKLKVKSAFVFIIIGIILWFTMLKSGIHSTFAGVLLGMTIPGATEDKEFEKSMLNKLEHKIAPWSSYLIMPIFALANAGVDINMNSISKIMTTPVSIGIILALFIGKQLGIFVVSLILVKTNIAELPDGVNKKHLYGASVLGGIGFTMSIFVASLSFANEATLSVAKISIIVASLLSAIYGLIIFNINNKDTLMEE